MKEIEFNCPKCNQHFEAAPELAGQQITCPSCSVLFVAPKPRAAPWKHAALWMLVIAIVLVRVYKSGQSAKAEAAAQEAFLNEINPTRSEDAFQTEQRLRQEADEQMLKGCSNYVGFSRVISHYLLAQSGQDPTNWQGEATIDFVNKIGGVDRTNLLFHVWVFDHHALSSIDDMAMWDRRRKEAEDVRQLEAKYNSQ